MTPQRRPAGTWAAVVVPSLVLLLLVLGVFWRLWTPVSGARRAFVYDALKSYWGDLQFQADAFRRGELPLWNPFERGGYPAHADPQPGLLYPLSWPFILAGAILSTPWWLIAGKIVLHFWLAAAGTFFYLRRRAVARFACYAGAALAILTYPFSHAMFSTINWGVAWAPWILLALDEIRREPRIESAVLVAVATACCLLAGGPAGAWYALLVAVPYGGWTVVDSWRNERGGSHPTRRLCLYLGLSTAVFLALVSGQVVSTAGLVAQSVRADRGLGFVGTSVLGAHDVFGFLVPRLPGQGAYLTFLGVFAAAAVLSRRPTGRRAVLALVCVGGVLLAWGSGGPFLPFAASLGGPFGFFRRAHRYLFVAMVPFSILAAEGLDLLARVRSVERRPLRRVFIVVGLAGALMFGVAFLTRPYRPKQNDPFREACALAFVSVVVSSWVAWQLVARRDRWRGLFAVTATLVVVADIWFARAPAIERNWAPLPDTSSDRIVLDDRRLDGACRFLDRGYLGWRPGTRMRRRDFGGYEDDPLSLKRFDWLRRRLLRSPRLLGHANVCVLLEDKKKATRKTGADLAAMRERKPGVFELRGYAPRAYWTDDVRAVGGKPEAALRVLSGAAPGTIAVVERPIPGLTPGPEATGPVVADISSFSLNALALRVRAPRRGVVVVNETFYPGWTVTVDGRPAPIIPVNHAFRGVVVDAGEHRIAMRYAARAFELLGGLSMLSFVAAAGLLFWRPSRRRRPPADR
jgi:hypothetical protein